MPSYGKYFLYQAIYLCGVLIFVNREFTAKGILLYSIHAQIIGLIFVVYGLTGLLFWIRKIFNKIKPIFLVSFFLILFFDTIALFLVYPNVYTFILVFASIPFNSFLIMFGLGKGVNGF